MLALMRLIGMRLTPKPKRLYVAAYTLALLMGVGFLIGTSPTLASFLDGWRLGMWHVAVIIGSAIAIIGVVRGAPRVEIAGLFSVLASLVVYAGILTASVAEARNQMITLGFAALVAFLACMVLARIGMEIEGLRAVERIDAIGG